MKKYFILFICLIGILFSSCAKREDPYSWSFGQMEIDEMSSETTVEEKVELPSSLKTKLKSTVPEAKDAIILQTKCLDDRMLMLVQIPSNPISKYEFWKDGSTYTILGIIYVDADHHRIKGHQYGKYDEALAMFNAGYIEPPPKD